MKKHYILFYSLLLLAFRASATHIVGGEFELRHLSGNNYRLNLNLYFDLVNGDPGARDPSITVGIFEKGTNVRKANLVLNLQTETEIKYTDIACAKPGELQTSKLIYSRDIGLSSISFNHPQGYYVVWERCCRNNTINNIVDPGGSAQAFYMEFPAVTRNGQDFRNSSPILFPPLSDYACLNELFYYDFGGTDPDGDSLVYDLVTPLNGASTRNNPAPTPTPAPYSTVNWTAGHNQQNQVIGAPSITIHQNTGRLTVRPTRSGLFVFGIRCQEYRRGVKIGEVRRDFQLMVRRDCQPNTKPVVMAVEQGKSTFYKKGDVMRVTPTGERCINIKFTDPDPTTRISLKLQPVNFINNNTFTLSGVTSGTINTSSRSDTLTASVCFADCFDTEGRVYEMDLIAADNGCSQPKLDTLRLRFMVEPVPDAPPAITLSTPARTFTVRDGDFLNFNVIGSDADGDIISMTARGVGFDLASQNITFQSRTGAGPLTSAFSWPIDCQVLQRESYQIEFQVTTEACGKTKTTTELVTIRTQFPNNVPVISTDQQTLRFNLTVDQRFEAKIFGNDIDMHQLMLQAAGQGFNLADFGMNFQATGGAGSAAGTFNWVANCEAAKRGTIRVDFILKETACISSPDQKLTLEFVVNFPNNTPVISSDKQNLVFELDLHEAFEANLAGTDIDMHQLMLAAAGQGFNLADYGMSFQATGGQGNAAGVFKWVANCDAAQQGVVRVDFLLKETACIPSPDQKLTMEFRVKVPDTQTFIPANIFTPNNDGLNDYFEMPSLPVTTCKGTFERITIYNRWGKEVYSSNDVKFRWDGRNVNAGVYYYIIDYSTTVFKGSVTLVH